MTDPAPRARHERHTQWLLELTDLPTAAGREERVIEWVQAWADARRDVHARRDRAGNMILSRAAARPSGRAATRGPESEPARKPTTIRPIFITAHLDHPAFVVRRMRSAEQVELEFRGSVHDPYFDRARIDIFDSSGRRHRAIVELLDVKATPFKVAVAKLERPAARNGLSPGDIGRWSLSGKLPRVKDDLLHAHACDDLAGVAAALSTLDVLLGARGDGRSGAPAADVRILLTRAEEVGFIGAIAACRNRSVPRGARLICLENSRSFADSPIGAGPILRVGDRSAVFDPALTNQIGAVITQHASSRPDFRWQRKLMPGGTCEATAFGAYGFEATCVCLPLGNYHNMRDIDAVLAGRRPARVGPEIISLADYHGMIELLAAAVRDLDSARVATLRDRMEKLYEERGYVLA